MNHLAHLYLSFEDEEIMIGNFIADYIRNKEVATYSERIQKGIFLHRKIDTFMDSHPVVKQGVIRLHENHSKYAPVVIDIFYDYFLTKNWKTYHKKSLRQFTSEAYQILQKNKSILPAILQERLPRMVEHDWLRNYGNYNGLSYVFKKMDQRTKFPSHFHKAIIDLKEDKALLQEEFSLYFPEVIAFVNEQKNVLEI